ncbi:hypothetical protein ACM66B_003788 [Microbotryomycetes sp. NB124-2]
MEERIEGSLRRRRRRKDTVTRSLQRCVCLVTAGALTFAAFASAVPPVNAAYIRQSAAQACSDSSNSATGLARPALLQQAPWKRQTLAPPLSQSSSPATVAAATSPVTTAAQSAGTFRVTTDSNSAADSAAATKITATTTVTKTASATASLSTSTTVPSSYQLPEAFDSTLGTNFTSTACPSFFQTFLADPQFYECAPFSLLLGTSAAFFDAQKNPFSLVPYVLNASCTANETACSALMSSLATNIRLSNTCGEDLRRQNPLVVQALQGFQNYALMREAGCQVDDSTGRYCFAEACAAATPDQLYFYYLPEGTSLPSGTSTECDSCTQGLMNIYARYALNSTLAISGTYSSARSLTVLDCGPTFAPVVAASTSTSAAATTTVRGFRAANTLFFDFLVLVCALGFSVAFST